jgi:hypothetical protein
MATISITDATIFTALRTFILACIPSGLEVVQGQDNGVPMPAGNFCAMTAKSNGRLEWNVDNYTDPVSTVGTVNTMTPSEFVVQLDFYGTNSAQNAKIIEALSRSQFALSSFSNVSIKPLYADDPQQMPLINGEQQYEQRWKMDFHIQYNPIIYNPQEFADTLDINVISVEATYPQ